MAPKTKRRARSKTVVKARRGKTVIKTKRKMVARKKPKK